MTTPEFTMALTKEFNKSTREWELKWRRVSTENLSEAEVMAWQNQWMGLVVQGFERNRNEKKKLILELAKGQAILDKVAGLMVTRYKNKTPGF